MRAGIVGASGKLGRYMIQPSFQSSYEVFGVCRELSVDKLDDLKDRIAVILGATNHRKIIKV
jgi:putative NADH-flavin reductase